MYICWAFVFKRYIYILLVALVCINELRFHGTLYCLCALIGFFLSRCLGLSWFMGLIPTTVGRRLRVLLFPFSIAVLINMVKMCKYHSNKRCYHSSCSIFNPISGKVVLCPLFRGGDFLTPRKIVVDLRSDFR